jgi:hypothetical protein
LVRPEVVWMPTPDQQPLFAIPPPDSTAIHAVLNCFLSVALPGDSGHSLSAIRVLMLLNQVDPTESTSNFRGGSQFMRYPAEPLPQIQKNAPPGVMIAHYHVPPLLLQALDEDRPLLKEGGVEWGILPADMEGLFVVNHRPQFRQDGKKAYKSHALEVRDGLLTSPSVSQLLESVLIIGQWDVLIRPKIGVHIPALASALQNLDHYLLHDASSFTQVYPDQKVGVCHDPDILVFYPLHLLSAYVLSIAASISPVQSHQDLGKAGSLLIRFQQTGIAGLLYGLRLSTPNGPISFTCGDGSQDAIHEQQLGLAPLAPLSARQTMFPSVAPMASLTHANLQAISAESGNGIGGRGTPPPS